MANMAYCRFENTYRDLLDCKDHFDDDLSPDEMKYRKRILETCKYIVKNYAEDEEDEE